MEISRRRSLPSDFNAPSMSPAASSYPPTYINCRTNVYTMQGIKLPPESKSSKSFAMQSSLSIDSATSDVLTPKKEHFWSSMFGALTSAVVERFTKGTGSFMSNINSTLSVTIVRNEGIISQEFFKNLTQSCEQLPSASQCDSIESSRMKEHPSNKTFYDAKSHISHIFTENTGVSPLSGKVSLNLRDNSMMDGKEFGYNYCEKNNKTELDIKCTPSVVIQQNNDRICQNNKVTMMEDLDTEVIVSGDCESSTSNSMEAKPEINESCSSRSAAPKIEENPDETTTPEDTTRWHTMWHKVVNGASDRFNPRAPSPESEVPTKKANLSKPRRKTCLVARGRGGHKGRGKSQLRRSGVSQSRHRKERTKQNIYSNIQDDLEDWEDSERYDESGDEEMLRGKCRIDEQRSQCQESDHAKHCSTLYENFTFDEASKSRKRKQRIRDGSVKCPMRVRYVPETSSMEVGTCDNSFIDEVDCTSRISNFRPRLVSESSVDSEDSYCIVFESGSDSEYTDYDYDAVSDDDLDEDEKITPRVRFNLEPQVHTMFQWDYAYRAARRGPWEEMVRDRERFRSRIHCIERIIDPILSSQHRKCVWQDRFDVDH